MRRVVVTGVGAVSPLGVGLRRSWRRLLDGQSGIVSLIAQPDIKTAPVADSILREHDDRPGKDFAALPSRIAGLIPRGSKDDGAWDPREWLEASEIRTIPLFTQYALAATAEALESASLQNLTPYDRSHAGVVLGSGIGSFKDVYDTSVAFASNGYKKVSPHFVPRLLINLGAGHVALKYGLEGPNHSPTTACTTGLHALASAFHILRLPYTASPMNVMVAGAAESCIHPLAIAGFARARSLSTASNDYPEKASRPFHTARDGFVIAEGAAVFILETLDHALARKAPILAEVLGQGASCDAHHTTAPIESGRGAAKAMRDALRDAGVFASEVGYVNAHATSTGLGDLAESRAIRTVFCDEQPSSTSEKVKVRETKTQRTSPLAVSSTKGATGHLLGAAGALEAAFAVMALQENIIPGTLNLQNHDSTSGLDDKIKQEMKSASPSANGIIFPENSISRDLDVVMTNSFGFGGTNASMCFGRWKGR